MVGETRTRSDARGPAVVRRGSLPALLQQARTWHARLVVNTFHENKPAAPASEKLTRREEDVLRQIVQGARTKEVADALKIAVPTVQTHLQHIYDKLHARSRSEAVAKYLIGF